MEGELMVDIKMLSPDGLAKPRPPLNHVARVKASELAFIAGQVPVDESGALVGKNDFEAQCERVYANIHLALRSVAADWSNVVQFTSYLVRPDDRTPFLDYRNRAFPTMFHNGAYPTNTLLVVNHLAHEDYLLEIQAIAAL
jgi:enamine deaminase RidA (YjgF/YER057c/UK114 family)